MPVIATSPVESVTNLADLLASQVASGGTGARATLGARDTAFGWTLGAPAVIARFTNNALVEGLSFTAVTVQASGTPAGKVAEGAPKPTAVTLVSADHALSKYAGLARFTTERLVGTDSLVPVVYQALIGQALTAYDADCATALGAAASISATGATWAEAILAGYAEVAGTGTLPDLLVMNGADYAATFTTLPAGNSVDPTSGSGGIWGLRVLISAGVPAGTAYVLPAAACMAVESVISPLVTLDPYTLADTNEIRLVADLFAGFVVTSPGNVAEVTVTVVP